MDGVLPITDAGKELLSQGLLGIAVVFLLWVIGRREQEKRDLTTSYEVKIAEKDKLILQLQESRLEETKALVEVVSSNNQALLANKTGIDSLMPILQQIAGSHSR